VALSLFSFFFFCFVCIFPFSREDHLKYFAIGKSVLTREKEKKKSLKDSHVGIILSFSSRTHTWISSNAGQRISKLLMPMAMDF
jgi:hypothetical protein